MTYRSQTPARGSTKPTLSGQSRYRGRAAELGLRTWERGDAPQWEPAERVL
jgi:hypothetical protein